MLKNVRSRKSGTENIYGKPFHGRPPPIMNTKANTQFILNSFQSCLSKRQKRKE